MLSMSCGRFSRGSTARALNKDRRPMLIESLALIAAASFAGACAYINIVEQPARLDLAPGPLLAQWTRSYHRGTAMQLSSAIVAAALGVASFVDTRGTLWLVGTAFLLTIAPYTLLGIMPTNRRLLAIAPASDHAWVTTGVRRWGRLHAGRTLLGISATIAFLLASL